MAFVAARLQLHEGIAIKDGVVPVVERLRLVETHDLIEHMLQRARDEADSLVSKACEDAQKIRQDAAQERGLIQAQALERAELLINHINQEWRRAFNSLEFTIFSVARVAIERLCAGSTLAERLDAVTRVALSELPEKALRLHVPRGCRNKVPEDASAELDVVEDPELPSDCVRLEGNYGTCEVNFDIAKISIISHLASWSNQPTEPV